MSDAQTWECIQNSIPSPPPPPPPPPFTSSSLSHPLSILLSSLPLTTSLLASHCSLLLLCVTFKKKKIHHFRALILTGISFPILSTSTTRPFVLAATKVLEILRELFIGTILIVLNLKRHLQIIHKLETLKMSRTNPLPWLKVVVALN